MTRCPNLFGGTPQKQVDRMSAAVSLARAIDGRKRLLCGNGTVEGLGWGKTAVTVLAGLAAVTEVLQQDLSPETNAFCVTEKGAQLAMLQHLAFGWSIVLLNHAPVQGNVLKAE